MIIKSEGNINEDQSKRGKKPFVARIACFRIVDVFSPLLSASMEQKFFSSLTSPLYAIPHCYPSLDENRFTLNRDVHKRNLYFYGHLQYPNESFLDISPLSPSDF